MSLEVGAVVKIANGAGIEEVRIKVLEHYHLEFVRKTPKGRWGSKAERVSRRKFAGLRA